MGKLNFHPKRSLPKKGQYRSRGKIIILCAVSLVFFIVARYVPLERGGFLNRNMREASRIMGMSVEVIRECREKRRITIDKRFDVNETGLIGVDYSSITTSLGNLEAKRTTTNPNFAALVIYLLRRAGVKEGDTVAVGASSSFPALIVATLSAARAMKVELLMVNSLGASQWGTNIPGFHWLRVQDCLQKAGVFDTIPVAVSLGGENDVGSDMSPEGREMLLHEIRESGILFIYENDLVNNVNERMRVYEENAGEREIRAFINIGGSSSNMGQDSSILEVKPGLAAVKTVPPPERRGVIHEMVLRKVPIIHLLFIKGLVERYKLPWDPSPLPEPGEGGIYLLAGTQQPSFLILAVCYFLCTIIVLFLKIK